MIPTNYFGQKITKKLNKLNYDEIEKNRKAFNRGKPMPKFLKLLELCIFLQFYFKKVFRQN